MAAVRRAQRAPPQGAAVRVARRDDRHDDGADAGAAGGGSRPVSGGRWRERIAGDDVDDDDDDDGGEGGDDGGEGDGEGGGGDDDGAGPVRAAVVCGDDGRRDADHGRRARRTDDDRLVQPAVAEPHRPPHAAPARHHVGAAGTHVEGRVPRGASRPADTTQPQPRPHADRDAVRRRDALAAQRLDVRWRRMAAAGGTASKGGPAVDARRAGGRPAGRRAAGGAAGAAGARRPRGMGRRPLAGARLAPPLAPRRAGVDAGARGEPDAARAVPAVRRALLRVRGGRRRRVPPRVLPADAGRRRRRVTAATRQPEAALRRAARRPRIGADVDRRANGRRGRRARRLPAVARRGRRRRAAADRRRRRRRRRVRAAGDAAGGAAGASRRLHAAAHRRASVHRHPPGALLDRPDGVVVRRGDGPRRAGGRPAARRVPCAPRHARRRRRRRRPPRRLPRRRPRHRRRRRRRRLCPIRLSGGAPVRRALPRRLGGARRGRAAVRAGAARWRHPQRRRRHEAALRAAAGPGRRRPE